jgi:hypothetical protein
MLDGSVKFIAADRLLRGYASLAEPWLFGIKPESAGDYLRQRGLRLDRDLAAASYRHLYYGKDSDRMTGYEFYHTAIAHVIG